MIRVFVYGSFTILISFADWVWSSPIPKTEGAVDSKCAQHRPYLFEKCQMDYIFMSIWCDHMNLTGVPHPEHPRIQTQTPAFRAVAIYLNDSCIVSLDPDILALYSGLKLFNCDDNELTEITSKTFAENSKLQNLTLSRNRIADLSDNAFEGLSHLQELSLRSNKLRRLRANVFNDLRALLRLDLSDNLIEEIDRNTFLHLQNLRELDLSGNKLTFLSPRWCVGMVDLDIIVNDSTYLFYIYRTVINELLHHRTLDESSPTSEFLRVLNLHGNELTNPSKEMFRNNRQIKSVDFSGNNITCLPRDIFNKANVSFVDVSDNLMIVPRSEWFESVYKMRNAAVFERSLVAGNPWVCNCQAYTYWLFLRDEAFDDQWKRVFDVECASSNPGSLSLMLSSVSSQHFANCSDTEQQSCPEITENNLMTGYDGDESDDVTIGIKKPIGITTMQLNESDEYLQDEIDDKRSLLFAGIISVVIVVVAVVTLYSIRYVCAKSSKSVKRFRQREQETESSLSKNGPIDDKEKSGKNRFVCGKLPAEFFQCKILQCKKSSSRRRLTEDSDTETLVALSSRNDSLENVPECCSVSSNQGKNGPIIFKKASSHRKTKYSDRNLQHKGIVD